MNFKNNEWLIENGELKKYCGTSKEIIIPSGVTSINKEALNGLNIDKLVIPGSCLKLPALTLTFKPIKTLIFQEGIETIVKNACLGCNITSLSLPKSLKTIENSAFYNNNISTLELYDNLKVIAPLSFEKNPITKILIHNSGHVVHVLRELKKMPNTLKWFEQITSIIILDKELSPIELKCLQQIFPETNILKLLTVEKASLKPKKQISLEEKSLPLKTTPSIPNAFLTDILKMSDLDLEIKEIIKLVFNTAEQFSYPEISLLEKEIKNAITTYQKTIQSIKPTLNFNSNISLTLNEEDPNIIHANFLNYLGSIVKRLKTWHSYTLFIATISSYENIIINNDFRNDTNNDTINALIAICTIASQYHNDDLIKNLKSILNLTKKEIDNSLRELEKNPIEKDFETKLTHQIQALYEDAKRYQLIESTFRGENKSDLSKDIKTIYEAISYFSKNDQQRFKKKIDYEINFYKETLLNDASSNISNIELNLRANWHMTLIDINKNLPSAVAICHIIENITEALTILEKDSNISPTNVIGSTTKEIIKLLKDSHIKSEEYNLAIAEIKKLLTTWKDEVETHGINYINDEQVLLLPNDTPRKLIQPLNLELTVNILSKLYLIKYRITEDIKKVNIYDSFQKKLKK